MIRYLRLYLCFMRFSFSRALEFRFDFFFRIVMDVVYYAVTMASILFLFRHTEALGGWNRDQMIVFVGALAFTDALFMTLFANNTWHLPFLINDGSLDYHLTRPVSSLYFVCLRDFAANSFVNLVIASGILGWALMRYPMALGVGRVILFVATLVIGTVVQLFIRLLFGIPTFWTHSASGLRDLCYSVMVYAERPHQIYAHWLRRLLLTMLPLAFIASIPTHLLFEGPSWRTLLHMFVVFAVLWAFVVWFWRRGLRAYASASS